MRASICTLLCMLPALPVIAAQEITTEEAIARLESYGLIRPDSTESTNGIELIWHLRKLKNGDEEINDYPWLIEILNQGRSDNHVPISCVKPFVEAGATLKGDGENTALSMAAHHANWKVMRYLIEAGADIHEKYDGKLMADIIILGATDEATHLSKGAAEILMLLIDKGYKPSAEEFEEIAGYPGTASVMKRLIKAGATVTHKVCNNALYGANADGVVLLHEAGHILPDYAEDEDIPPDGVTSFYPDTLARIIRDMSDRHAKLTIQHETLLRELLAIPFIKEHTDSASIRDALHDKCSRDFSSFIDELYPPATESEEEDYDEEEEDDG